jgi:hypothetical protein
MLNFVNEHICGGCIICDPDHNKPDCGDCGHCNLCNPQQDDEE